MLPCLGALAYFVVIVEDNNILNFYDGIVDQPLSTSGLQKKT